jgi:hypothetical protein
MFTSHEEGVPDLFFSSAYVNTILQAALDQTPPNANLLSNMLSNV